MSHDSKMAALCKTLTYCLMHLTVAVAVAYALTRDWAIALSIGLIEPMVQTVCFFFHERAWTRALHPVPVRVRRHSR